MQDKSILLIRILDKQKISTQPIKSPGSGRNLVPLFPQKLNLPLFRGKLFYFLGNKQKQKSKYISWNSLSHLTKKSIIRKQVLRIKK